MLKLFFSILLSLILFSFLLYLFIKHRKTMRQNFTLLISGMGLLLIQYYIGNHIYAKEVYEKTQWILLVIMVLFYIWWLENFLRKNLTKLQKDIMLVSGAIELGITASLSKSPHTIFALNIASSIAYTVIPMYVGYLLGEKKVKHDANNAAASSNKDTL